jgi:hypothetical protein
MRSTFKVLFFLKRDKQKANGTIPLFCRITVDGQEVRFSMKCDVNPKYWDIKTGNVIGRTTEATQINSLNFDNLRKSHRCNPINPALMTDISDVYESAYTIMLNLNKTWRQKQGDFFVESPIILLAAIIWYLKIYDRGKYCTFPHAIEFLNQKYAETFPILTSYPQLENYLSPFMDAWEGGVARTDRFGKNPPVKNDFTATLLGDDRRRFYARHQQPQRTENPLCR